MSSQTHPSGITNSNIPLRIIAFARIRRLNGECCLGDVFEHPGPPNRWRRQPQAHPEEAKRAPRDTEEQPRAPEMKPREPARPPKKKPREPSRAPRQFLSKRPEITEVKIVLPPRRGHDFRCQRRGEGRTCPEEERLTPTPLRLGVRSSTSQNTRKNFCKMTKPAFYSNPKGVSSKTWERLWGATFCLRICF